MLAVIVGGGRGGSYLAQDLQAQGYRVRVVDRRPDVVARLRQEIEGEVICGDGCSPQVLEQVGAAEAGLLVADHDDGPDALEMALRLAAAPEAVALRLAVAPVPEAEIPCPVPAAARQQPSKAKARTLSTSPNPERGIATTISASPTTTTRIVPMRYGSQFTA